MLQRQISLFKIISLCSSQYYTNKNYATYTYLLSLTKFLKFRHSKVEVNNKTRKEKKVANI